MVRESGTGAASDTAATPPGQRTAGDDMAGTRRLGEESEMLVGADLADGDDHAGFTILERQTCFNLVATRDIGRIAFTIEGDAAPTVLPVNYALVNDTILLRSTLAGTVMRYARGYASFQVDHFDDERREGWSVLFTGRCRWVRDTGELSRIPQGRLPVPWAEGPRDQILKIVPGRVTGRQIHRS
ncbi:MULTISPECIES: pyridoxamine 5'-phosphate oxidase family protein [Nocardiopsis]|uniref:Pyridoxamine 5'-phosphate oxidase family protein n=1 Tax=Nocardiopsis lambiniae TaxID=3075539 RepID=A0ABU2MBX5_9ACTN|nr:MULTISPECIES: pyridoxamine 5'-phosphate oxidase family protein [unclassified Nocardiopsis]MDE3722283.1 pyridoxamine 5'-phosphate oxidase family protein [Nocardiopsis sp. N85]MDT0330182.1 pyridoxamine 5'-phosphate oxidase family protein [Nocardiopsis sp. DSM 44743]